MEFFNLTWQQSLGICYYLGAIASLLAVLQSCVDFYRKKQPFRLLGVPAHVGLTTALCFIILLNGTNPIFSREFMQIGVRLAFMTWAVFKLLFMLFYCVTHFGVRK